MTRPLPSEVDAAVKSTHSGERSEPFPYWMDNEHILAAEVIAQRSELAAARIELSTYYDTTVPIEQAIAAMHRLQEILGVELRKSPGADEPVPVFKREHSRKVG